jgi:hypothetical protein
MGEAEENDLIWKSDNSSVEIRCQGQLEDGRPALDEIVATGAAIHLEQMSHDQWWMGIEAGGTEGRHEGMAEGVRFRYWQEHPATPFPNCRKELPLVYNGAV